MAFIKVHGVYLAVLGQWHAVTYQRQPTIQLARKARAICNHIIHKQVRAGRFSKPPARSGGPGLLPRLDC